MANKALFQTARDFVMKAMYGKATPHGRLTSDLKSSLERSVTWQHMQKLSDASRFKAFCGKVNEHLNILAILFARQCNAIAVQKVRRAVQIVSLYHRLGYDRRAIQNVVERLSNSFLRNKKDKSLYFMFGAAMFAWQKEKFSHDDINCCIQEIQSLPAVPGTKHKQLPHDSVGVGWEKVIDRPHLVLWRKPISNSYLYEYKVFGTFYDIPARAFYNIQTDLEYRKTWDRLVIKLDVIDKDDNSGCEVVQWIMHYPFPMYSREYIYIRKTVVDQDQRVMLLMSHAVDHPATPLNPKYVRVNTYKSNMVIKPHSSFDEDGFDYILTYSDDPQAALPTPAYNWMASTGVPDFVDKMHDAAKKLQELQSPCRTASAYSQDDSEQITM